MLSRLRLTKRPSLLTQLFFEDEVEVEMWLPCLEEELAVKIEPSTESLRAWDDELEVWRPWERRMRLKVSLNDSVLDCASVSLSELSP